MTSIAAPAQNGKAITEKTKFSRTTSIGQTINADLGVIWALLTDSKNYPYWNSTIVSIDGTIAQGEKIKLKSTLDTSRVFKLKVKAFEANQKLVWGDGLGERTYTLSQTDNGVTFVMHEKIGGFMFPLFANKIPSFDEAFEQFTADLKKEAERLQGEK